MSDRDPRVDAYIRRSAPFAQPILKALRAAVHAASSRIEETMKWSFPHFTYKGILCSMAAFKEHATFGLWKGSLIIQRSKRPAAKAMGQFGRITSLKDLPSRKLLIAYVREAMRLNEEGVRSPTRAKRRKPRPLVIPPELTAALRKNAMARANFAKFTLGQRREYAEWIAEAKRDDTRARRLAAAVKQAAAGKPRYWQYL
jgi:uncharacterized protein YdeI (YjbR/CyaY-like superfamily)